VPDVFELARAWASDDPDPATRSQVEAWLVAEDLDALDLAFAGPAVRFGTSGIRGPLRPGPTGMNRRVARLVAAGLAEHLGTGTVVIGRDARHGSDALAADIAAVLAGAGLRVLAFPAPVPTPVLAFAVRQLRCDAGVIVTASHNPAGDNGIKVFAVDGGQISSPTDTTIAAAMDRVASVLDLPLGAAVHLDGVLDDYVTAAAERVPVGPRHASVVYTPLHGVAGEAVLALFDRAGFPPPHVVASQARPDPDFPTVAFPNPEEPGTLDLAVAEAERSGIDVVLATDPDGDRLGVVVRDGSGWRQLTGDEIGALLAEQALATTDGDDRVVATSLVSSTLLARMAEAAGVRCVVTRTGFKWIARAADDLPGDRLVFAYEEALGYAVHDLVKDKDGITAAAAFTALVASLRAEGRTVPDQLDTIARRHGLHVCRQWSIRASSEAIRSAMERLTAARPAELGGRLVEWTEWHDSHVLLELAGDARVIVRPSGTEPKLKRYFQVVVHPGDDLSAARAEAERTLEALRDDLDRLLGLGE
jgi:phosphomannomutase